MVSDPYTRQLCILYNNDGTAKGQGMVRVRVMARLGLGAVHILRNHFLPVSRPPPPFRNQFRHWIEQKLH